MAFAAQMTLADARSEVMTRLGFADQGTAATRAVKRVNSCIQQAANVLSKKVRWTPQVHELRIPLVVGQDRYEMPDETDVGQLTLTVEDINGLQHRMLGGIQQQNWLGNSTDPTLLSKIGQPSKWRVVDREIQIIPAPTDAFANLVVFYQDRTPILRDDGDELPFDSEAIIQLATVYGKVHYQQPGLQDAKEMAKEYIASVIAKQGPGRVFTAGGRQSHYLTRDKRVGMNMPQHIGPNSSYTTDWNPW